MNLVTREQWENCFLDKQRLFKITSLPDDLTGFCNDASEPWKISRYPLTLFCVCQFLHFWKKLHPLSSVLHIIIKHIHYWYVECNNIIINHIIFLVLYTSASLQQEHWWPHWSCSYMAPENMVSNMHSRVPIDSLLLIL